MFLKLIGIGLVFSAAVLTGFSLSKDYLSRINTLEYFQKMLLLLKGEIKYSNSEIVEAMKKVSEKTENVVGDFLKSVTEYFEKTDYTLSECWNRASRDFLESNTGFNDKDVLLIQEFGRNLGITDKETQINNIFNLMEEMDMKIKKLKDDREEKCRLYRTLGVMTGAFIAVVFI